MTINRFEEIVAWQKARSLFKNIFEYSKNQDFNKDYGFRDQIRRSSGSIMDNIAEGFERGTRKEFIQFLGYAKGSAGECRSQIYRAGDINYIQPDQISTLVNQCEEISRLLSSLINYLNTTSYKGERYKNRVHEKEAVYFSLEMDTENEQGQQL